MTGAGVDEQGNNPYAPPAETGSLQENQFSLSLENYTTLIRHNAVSRRSRKMVLVVGIVTVVVGIVLFVVSQKWTAGAFPMLFGALLLRARFSKNQTYIKNLYDRLKLDTKVFSFQIVDDGILIRDGRAYQFIPAEDIDRIDLVNELAIVVKNDVGLYAIHLQSEPMRSLVQKFKHDHSL
jgi:hypothetical protein